VSEIDELRAENGRLRERLETVQQSAAGVIEAWSHASWWAQDSNWDGMHRAVNRLGVSAAAPEHQP
jgi:hypothetical protein